MSIFNENEMTKNGWKKVNEGFIKVGNSNVVTTEHMEKELDKVAQILFEQGYTNENDDNTQEITNHGWKKIDGSVSHDLFTEEAFAQEKEQMERELDELEQKLFEQGLVRVDRPFNYQQDQDDQDDQDDQQDQDNQDDQQDQDNQEDQDNQDDQDDQQDQDNQEDQDNQQDQEDQEDQEDQDDQDDEVEIELEDLENDVNTLAMNINSIKGSHNEIWFWLRFLIGWNVAMGIYLFCRNNVY